MKFPALILNNSRAIGSTVDALASREPDVSERTSRDDDTPDRLLKDFIRHSVVANGLAP